MSWPKYQETWLCQFSSLSTTHLWYFCIVWIWILSNDSSPANGLPNHECIHRSFHVVRRVLLRLEMGKMKRCNLDTCRVFGFDKYFCVVERASYNFNKLNPSELLQWFLYVYEWVLRLSSKIAVCMFNKHCLCHDHVFCVCVLSVCFRVWGGFSVCASLWL